jgi:predicted DCC family thiol-disulfide oxidoreductase YuxK
VIVLYDGDCGFCRRSVDWALRRDLERRLTATPIQSSMGEYLLADLTPEQRLREVHVINDDGRRSSGGAAVKDVLKALPTTRGLARVVSVSPRMTQLGYRLIANNRGLFGKLVRARPAPRSCTPEGSPRTGGGDPPRRGGSR